MDEECKKDFIVIFPKITSYYGHNYYDAFF